MTDRTDHREVRMVSTFTTAALSIEAFKTTLKLTADGVPAKRINVLGDHADDYYDRDNSPYFQRAADTLLDERGYSRVGDWMYDHQRDAYLAPITTN